MKRDRAKTSLPGALLAILLLAAALRLVNLNGRPLWYDEAFAVLYAEKPPATILYGTLTPVDGAAADVHPLLYYLTLHFWMQAAGSSPLAVRLPSALFGLATVALVYALAAELFDARAGLWAAGLTAVAPFHVHYSQEARMYSLLCFLSLLAVYGFVRGWRRGGARPYVNSQGSAGRVAPAGRVSRPSDPGRPAPWVSIRPPLRYGLLDRRSLALKLTYMGGARPWLLFTVAGALSLYAHNLAFLTLLALDLFVLLARQWRLIKPLIAAHVGLALLFGPWLLVAPGQFGKVQQAYWVPRPGPAELIRSAIAFHFNLPLPSWLLPLALFLSLAAPALVLYRLLRGGPRSPQERGKWLLLLCLAALPPLLMFLISQWKSVYIERGVIAAAAAYYLLLGAALAGARLPRRRYALLLALPAAVAAVSLVYDYTFAGFPRPPFPQLIAALQAEAQPSDAIVHSNKLSFLPAHYYAPSLAQSFVADPPGSGSDTLARPTQEALGLFATDLETATAGQDRVWFIIFERAIQEYQSTGYANHPHLVWLEERFQRQTERRVSDLILYLYVRQPAPPPPALP